MTASRIFQASSYPRLSLQGLPFRPARLQALLLASLIAASTFGAMAVPAAQADDDGLMMISVASQPKSNTKTVQAKVNIDAPIDQVWDVITNYPEMRHILPGYEQSKLVKSNGNSKLLDIAMKVAAFLPTYRYRVQIQENENSHHITLSRISGDFKALQATYRLIQQGKQTILAYQLAIDPGNNLPGAQTIIKANTERSLRALEEYIEQEARGSVIGER